jgi:hypothetical protein
MVSAFILDFGVSRYAKDSDAGTGWTAAREGGCLCSAQKEPRHVLRDWARNKRDGKTHGDCGYEMLLQALKLANNPS